MPQAAAQARRPPLGHLSQGRVKTDIDRDDIWAYGLTIGLQAVAQVAIDDDWSAMRLKAV